MHEPDNSQAKDNTKEKAAVTGLDGLAPLVHLL
jgi:hypothetical protein